MKIIEEIPEEIYFLQQLVTKLSHRMKQRGWELQSFYYSKDLILSDELKNISGIRVNGIRGYVDLDMIGKAVRVREVSRE